MVPGTVSAADREDGIRGRLRSGDIDDGFRAQLQGEIQITPSGRESWYGFGGRFGETASEEQLRGTA
jgi:hypothetical protein